MAADVAFNASTESNRTWHLPGEFDFKHRILPGRTLSIRGDDLVSLHINWGITRWLEEGAFDAVIVMGWSSVAQQVAILACNRRRIPVILWSGSTRGEPSWGRTLLAPLVRALVRRCDAFIVYGTAAKEYLTDLGADPSRISIAYNTVDTQRWAATSAALDGSHVRAMLGLGGRTILLYVGQLIKRKGVDLLLEAMGRVQGEHPSLSLVIAGSGPLESKLRMEAARLKVGTVHFVGNVPNDQLPDYYRACDVVVLPSRSEVWGLTVNEAMACGRPVIVTDVVGSARDTIRPGETGWIARTNDVDSLASCIQRFTMTPQWERHRMGTIAQSLATSTFSLQRTADAIDKAVRVTLSTATVQDSLSPRQSNTT